MVDAHDSSGALEVMGEHEIVIDVWQCRGIYPDKPCTWEYVGFSPNILIDRSGDGVYPILVAKESWA